MNEILKLTRFVRPYRRRAMMALVFLTALVFMDLSIPRLIQRIIDQGIAQNSQPVVVQTAVLMLGISVASTLIAIGNNMLSVQVGAWRATCAMRSFRRYRRFPTATSIS
jgi:ABC-type multidrug transport system fused ATPase/permease subunit